MKFIALIPVVIVLSACVSQSTILTNQKGQWVRCSASGGGWLGAPMAAHNHSRCVEDFEKLGYIPVPDVSWGVRIESWQSQELKIIEVSQNSPAESAGIKTGDLIKFVDGQPVANGKELMKKLSTKSPGDSFNVTVERNGNIVSTTSILQKKQ